MLFIGAIATAVGNIVGGATDLAATKRTAEANAAAGGLNYLAQQAGGRTALEIEALKAENTKKIIVYVTVGIIGMIMLYFITRWAFKD